MKCSVYIAASVDGFIARPDGDIEWLHRPEYSEGQLNGLRYEEYMDTVDAVVMGRNTFDTVLSFDLSTWPYEGTPLIVLTGRKLELPDHLEDKVRVMSGAPSHIVETLNAEGLEHLYVDGGATIREFLREDLIREMTITRIPILLGSGLPLFGNNGEERDLVLIASTVSENGFVQERYRILAAR